MLEKDYLTHFDIDLDKVKNQYLLRMAISERLRRLLDSCSESEYVKLALGISDLSANYSADEHNLGPKILDNNSIGAVFRLAQKLADPNLKVTHVPMIIYNANLPYLKISVGSEIACLLQPSQFWVGNVRTIWSHLIIKHKGDRLKAKEELELYQIDDVTSEMNYKIWRDIYLSMENSLEIINRIASEWAKGQNIKPMELKYIWIDAICNALYENKNL